MGKLFEKEFEGEDVMVCFVVVVWMKRDDLECVVVEEEIIVKLIEVLEKIELMEVFNGGIYKEGFILGVIEGFIFC